MSETIVDNQEDTDYNTSKEDTFESLQEKYFEALTSGDQAAIKAAKEANEKFIGKMSPQPAKPEPTASEPEAKEVVTEEVATEEVKGSKEVAKSTQDEGTTAKDGGDTAKPEVSENTQAWLDTLTPEARLKAEELIKAKEYLEGWKRSTEGRLNAFQTVNAEKERLRRELLQLKQQSSTKPTPSVSSSAATAAKTITNKQLEEIRKDDPKYAEAIEAERAVYLERQEALERQVQELRQMAEQSGSRTEEFELTRKVETERNRLEQMWPGSTQAIDFYVEKDGKQLSPWYEFVSTLSPGAQQLAQSSSADDYAVLMPLYLNFFQGWAPAHGISFGSTDTQAPVETTTATSAAPRAQQIAQDRERRLSATPVVQGTTTTPVKSKPTLAEIIADPVLYHKEQLRRTEEEYKKLGLPFNPKDHV